MGRVGGLGEVVPVEINQSPSAQTGRRRADHVVRFEEAHVAAAHPLAHPADVRVAVPRVPGQFRRAQESQRLADGRRQDAEPGVDGVQVLDRLDRLHRVFVAREQPVGHPRTVAQVQEEKTR